MTEDRSPDTVPASQVAERVACPKCQGLGWVEQCLWGNFAAVECSACGNPDRRPAP